MKIKWFWVWAIIQFITFWSLGYQLMLLAFWSHNITLGYEQNLLGIHFSIILAIAVASLIGIEYLIYSYL